MKVMIDIPDEKVNKYGNDVLKISLTFVDRIVTQADGYDFYQLSDETEELYRENRKDNNYASDN